MKLLAILNLLINEAYEAVNRCLGGWVYLQNTNRDTRPGTGVGDGLLSEKASEPETHPQGHLKVSYNSCRVRLTSDTDDDSYCKILVQLAFCFFAPPAKPRFRNLLAPDCNAKGNALAFRI